MKLQFCLAACIIAFAVIGILFDVQTAHSSDPRAYLGFDRNDYPGDSNLSALRYTFSFAGYWLNVPPGAQSNSWVGKRRILRDAGFGFLVLFNGRLDAELKPPHDPAEMGRADAARAIDSAKQEGFPAGTMIFLDQEEGGRMLPEQKAYIYAWVDGINSRGYRAGIYCSGIAAPEGGGVSVVTANDIKQNAGNRQLVYWVTNDACPPSPGCAFPRNVPSPGKSGVGFATVWQYAQSPKRHDFARGCRTNYAGDGNCYPPALEGAKLFVDLDAADSSDPSNGK